MEFPLTSPPRGVRNVRLTAALAAADISGQQLAELTGVHPNTVSALLRQRRRPTQSTADRIAAALGQPTAELFAEVLLDRNNRRGGR